MAREDDAYDVLARCPMPALVVDDSGNYTFANAAACALLGRNKDELLGLTIPDISAPDADVEEAWQRFAADGAQEGEFRIARPDGSVVSVQFRASTDFLPGRHISFLADVTDRRRIETQLRRNEELYVRAFSASPAPTNILKLSNGVFVEVNEAFTAVTGFWRSDVVGRSARTLGLWKDQARLNALLDSLTRGEAQVTVRAELQTKDKQAREFSVSMRRVEIAGEDHVISVYTDIATL